MHLLWQTRNTGLKPIVSKFQSLVVFYNFPYFASVFAIYWHMKPKSRSQFAESWNCSQMTILIQTKLARDLYLPLVYTWIKIKYLTGHPIGAILPVPPLNNVIAYNGAKSIIPIFGAYLEPYAVLILSTLNNRRFLKS